MDEERMSDAEIMEYLDDTAKDRYLKLQRTFESDGWALLVEYAQAKAFQAGVEGANAKSWDDNRRAYGNRQAWEEMAQFADAFMNEFEMVAQQNKEAVAETFAEGYE